MKFYLTFKTPDVLDQLPEGMSPPTRIAVARVVDKYFEYEEYVTVEGDTDTGEMIVVPNDLVSRCAVDLGDPLTK